MKTYEERRVTQVVEGEVNVKSLPKEPEFAVGDKCIIYSGPMEDAMADILDVRWNVNLRTYEYLVKHHLSIFYGPEWYKDGSLVRA